MKKLYIVLLLAVGCQSVSIKNQQYKISETTTELGSIGQPGKVSLIKNRFTPFAFPKLENKIRVNARILPFTKKIYSLYKTKVNTSNPVLKINYADSLEKKPEYVLFDIFDKGGLLEEYNAEYNKDIVNYLINTKKAMAVTGTAVALSPADIEKIRNASAFYLINRQDKKYTIALYKDGKKTDELDLHYGVTLAYNLGGFCWALNEYNKWYIADITEEGKSCNGATLKKIKKKQETNLFNM